MFSSKKIFDNVLSSQPKYSESKHLEAKQGSKLFLQKVKNTNYVLGSLESQRGRNTKPTKEKYISQIRQQFNQKNIFKLKSFDPNTMRLRCRSERKQPFSATNLSFDVRVDVLLQFSESDWSPDCHIKRQSDASLILKYFRLLVSTSLKSSQNIHIFFSL